ncbi:hypothetical protein ABIG06_006261 [Bradyrhizobium sp. USDA 326]|uniref:hypothetical protein n=1 Tax=unclassified Bradyrhizobium TaxID=2631580 RepID=UPI003514AA36
MPRKNARPARAQQSKGASKPGSGGKAVAKPSSSKPRKAAQAARRSAAKRTERKTSKPKKKGKTRMTGKKHDDDDRVGKAHEKRDTKGEGAYREGEIGSTQPSQTTMANPGPENRPFEQAPTEDPMATPEHSTLPNPPSAPGGDQTGDSNTTPTGERLPEDHPDYKPPRAS